MKVAVQGLGAVGWGVAERLHAEGARLVVSDVSMDQVERAVERFGASVAPVDKIQETEVDLSAHYPPVGLFTEAHAPAGPPTTSAGARKTQTTTAGRGRK